MIQFTRPRIGGSFFNMGGQTATDWGQVGLGGINAIGNWAVAREQRRAIQAGGDANAVAAMRGSTGAFLSGGNAGFAALALGGLALVLLLR